MIGYKFAPSTPDFVADAQAMKSGISPQQQPVVHQQFVPMQFMQPAYGQPYYVDQRYGRPASSDAGSTRGPPGIVGSSKEKAEEVRTNMNDIISTLTTLAKSHADLKSKYLATRRSTLEKYFVENWRMLVSVTFLEWKTVKNNIVEGRRHSLLVDQLYQERENHGKLRGELESAFEQKVKDVHEHTRRSICEMEEKAKHTVGWLKDEAKMKTALCEQMKADNETLRARLQKQNVVISSICQQVQGLEAPESSENEAFRQVPEPTAYVKDRLHDILQRIDAKYVPPLAHSLHPEGTSPRMSLKAQPQTTGYGFRASVQM